MNGEAISEEEFIRRSREDRHWRTLRREDVGAAEVSTVLLSIDHGFADGAPIIFETMVFPECDVCRRYCTKEEALAGHDEIVAELKAGLERDEANAKDEA